MKTVQKITAEKLLKVKAIKLQPTNPFTWASGWKSPIYCDNRKLMSYPLIRNFLKVEFARIIMEKYPQTDAIAGVATGAIAPGALVADLLGLPFVYIRSSPKDHGLENLIEGDLKPKQKVVVIEDLVSTGGSSLKAVDAIRQNCSDVLGMLAIFTYGFKQSMDSMHEARVELTTLCNYDAILDEALAVDYIDESELKTLQDWRKDPENWGQSDKKIKL
ncbi:MAG: orotate phosphoribosyltransferase [Bacteroidales bacterium]|nr:orotate phosphoribosyltransferase [Bacteroidales bacterium]